MKTYTKHEVFDILCAINNAISAKWDESSVRDLSGNTITHSEQSYREGLNAASTIVIKEMTNINNS